MQQIDKMDEWTLGAGWVKFILNFGLRDISCRLSFFFSTGTIFLLFNECFRSFFIKKYFFYIKIFFLYLLLFLFAIPLFVFYWLISFFYFYYSFFSPHFLSFSFSYTFSYFSPFLLLPLFFPPFFFLSFFPPFLFSSFLLSYLSTTKKKEEEISENSTNQSIFRHSHISYFSSLL